MIDFALLFPKRVKVRYHQNGDCFSPDQRENTQERRLQYGYRLHGGVKFRENRKEKMLTEALLPENLLHGSYSAFLEDGRYSRVSLLSY
jgi:hypothetical protein